MAQKNNLLSVLLSSIPNFFSQLFFGIMLVIIARILGLSLIFSIFLGIIGGVALGWFTTTDETSPPPVIPSNEGIDAGLKYWLFFILGFTFLLRYPAPISILLGAIGGLGGGWVIAWWRSKEDTKTQLPAEIIGEAESEEPEITTSRKIRRKARRFRRGSEPGGLLSALQFWKR